MKNFAFKILIKMLQIKTSESREKSCFEKNAFKV